MDTDNWINLIAAILVGSGTLFLGIMAWRTIRQTRSIQKAEKRQKLLNEIIEWAIDVHNCSFGHTITIEPQIEEKKQRKLALGNKILRY